MRLIARVAFGLSLAVSASAAPRDGRAAEAHRPAASDLRAADARSDAELLAGAEQRIERRRKADASVSVVDRDDRPVPGARVDVEQTRHAFLFGCNIFLWGRVGNPADEATYRRRFADLFNYATLPFYWASYEPDRGRPDHERIAQIARWCRDNGVTTKGHPLAWNYADPRWLPDDISEIRRLQMARIDDCVSHFRGLIDIWDVVNEATHFERESFRQRAPKMTAMWEQTGRIDFVRQCFSHARRANPEAVLLINDYRNDPPYARVIEGLADPGGRLLCDVIGLQSHMHDGPWSNRKIWDACERFARFGLPLHFTETTIVSGQLGGDVARRTGSWPSTQAGEAFQAKEIERFYTMVFSHPAVEAITWWDFSDRGAWKQAPAGFLRRDLTPKPAYLALIDLVKGKWWTRTSVVCDRRGEARFRGMLGQYRITVRIGDREPVVRTMELRRGAPNRLVVKGSS